MKRSLSMVWAGMTLLLAAGAAQPCPLLARPTYRDELQDAALVLLGTVTDSRLFPVNGVGTEGESSTTIEIKTALKSDPRLGKRTSITIPEYIPVPDKKAPPKFVVFCDISKGEIVAYRGLPVKSDAAVAYIKGLMATERKGNAAVLCHCFDYLEHPDEELAADAYREFERADDRELAAAAPKVSAANLRSWLKDSKTPAHRYGRYGWMLALCGKAEDAKLLREMVEDKKSPITDSGLLSGYVLLQPKEGWEYVRSTLSDERGRFTERYAALRTARLFHNERPGVIPTPDVVEAVSLLLDQGDIADLAIEDLRKWGCWDMTDRILALYDRKSHDVPIIRRSILRFALAASDPKMEKPNPKAAAFVANLRKKGAQMVEDAEELLRLESTADKPPAGK